MSTPGSATEILPAERVSGGAEDPVLLERLAAAGFGAPEAVLHPESTGEAAAIMRWASVEGVGVLPLASGARLRPRPGDATGRWVVLRTDRLSEIEEYEAADLTLTAGAGTPMARIDSALRANGQWAPFDPPLVLERSLGGLVADAASGPLWTGYGELRNHVLGATVVTGDGRVLRLGGRVVKNVAGFDLLKPMTGSRGSLAVMTAVTLRAFPVPGVDQLLTVRGASVGELLPLALRTGTAPVLPVSCLVTDAGDPTLVVRLHGAPSTVAADRGTIESHVGVSFEVETADGAAELLARARDHAMGAVVVEASARPSRVASLLTAAEALVPSGTVIDGYGGRVRLALRSVSEEALRSFTAQVEKLGGAVGIVRATPPSLSAAASVPSPDEAALVDRLRHAFDPEGVLWPAR